MVFGNRTINKRSSSSSSKHLQQNPQSYGRHEVHIYHIAEFLAWQDGRLYISLLLPDARTDFLLPTINGYVMFAGSSEEDKNSSKLKRKEIICGWEHTDFIIGQIERISTIPGREKKAHSLFDWKISKTDHVRLAVNIFVGNLDRGNDTKLAKKLFLLKKNILFLILVSLSRKFH